MSLRWKIALALAAIVSVSSVVVGTIGYRSTRDRLYEEVDRSLVTIEGRVNERWLNADGDFPADRGPFAGYDAQIITLDGTVVQSTFPTPLPVSEADLRVAGERGRSVIRTVSTEAGDYRVRTVGFQRGAVQVARSLDETERVLRGLRARLLLWTAVVAAAAIAVGLWIAGRVTASLRRLTSAAEEVEATGRLDVQVGDDRLAGGTDEVGRLGAAFDRMLLALARSKDDQRRLVQDAGHELRTPLTSLRTNLDTLQRYPDLGDADRDAIIADLQAETRELTDLVNEIVTVASGAQSDEAVVPFDLVEAVREVVDRYERRSGRTIDVEATPSPVVAQRSAVQRAVSCLLDNACKFSDGQVTVTVGNGAVIVRDRGPGIAPEELGRVFDRFHRAESARTLPGSGLGLSIVREIAERHGGDAAAANAPDGGAVVSFRLPARPVVGGAVGTDGGLLPPS